MNIRRMPFDEWYFQFNKYTMKKIAGGAAARDVEVPLAVRQRKLPEAHQVGH